MRETCFFFQPWCSFNESERCDFFLARFQEHHWRSMMLARENDKRSPENIKPVEEK